MQASAGRACERVELCAGARMPSDGNAMRPYAGDHGHGILNAASMRTSTYRSYKEGSHHIVRWGQPPEGPQKSTGHPG